MVELENGAIVKSIHGGLYRNSIWYSMSGSKGRMETAREDAQNGDFGQLYVNVDVYEALDMAMPGIFAYRSILNGGIPMEIPNFRDKAVREQWRADVACTDPEVAGDMLLPTCKLGTPEIDPAVYELVRQKWEEEKQSESGYTQTAFKQGGAK